MLPVQSMLPSEPYIHVVAFLFSALPRFPPQPLYFTQGNATLKMKKSAYYLGSISHLATPQSFLLQKSYTPSYSMLNQSQQG